MKPQKVGRYRQRVTLFDIPEASQDTYGQPSQAPTSLGAYWAEVRPLRGSEMLNVRAVWPTASHLVSMRWLGFAIPTSRTNPNGLILPRMVLQVGVDSSFLHILFANDVEKRNRSWQLTCEERIGATA
jgi:head-tail adaptor